MLFAFFSALSPPSDLLQAARGGVYTAYFNWGLVSSDGGHIYVEVYGYRFAANLWKVVYCDAGGSCYAYRGNVLSLYFQLRASGLLSISGSWPCFDVALGELDLWGRVFSFSGSVCFDAGGALSEVRGVLRVHNATLVLSGGPLRVERRFREDLFFSIFGD